ncbi:MAG: hypothetical protein JJU40_02970 [Rhodobacteraceae bacterium]|nr:hypothetical protein [Paracoccaceae bacterium]
MTQRGIDYGNLMHRAMRGLMAEVLQQVCREGLPGEHHFFITFDTRHPDVAIADWLRERFPEEMTVVLQHWFADLSVRDEVLRVTLNFGDNPEPLVIPLDAVTTFVDPSVEFGLRFERQESTDEDDEEAGMIEDAEEADNERREADVVSLDAFRK